MMFGDPGGLKLSDICLTGEEKPRETLTQETCPDRGSNPGPLRDRRAWYRLAHSGRLIQCPKYPDSNDDNYNDNDYLVTTITMIYDISSR